MKVRSGRSFFHLNPTVRAAVLMFTTVVGAGVLGIPYTVANSGLVYGSVLLVGIGVGMLIINLLIGEMIARTKKHLQLAGLVRRYVGRGGAILTFIVFLGINLSALVAYLIGEGQGLAMLLGGEPFFWSLMFFMAGTLVVLGGTKKIALLDTFLSVFTFSALLLLGVWGIQHGQVAPSWWPSIDWQPWLNYGVFISAFNGLTVLAEMEVAAGDDARALRRGIIIGSVAPIILYLLFAVGMVMAMGHNTTEMATVGLLAALGPRAALLGNLFAVVAMGTCFVNVSQAVKRTFEWDLGWHRWLALGVALGLPLTIFLCGARQFVTVIGTAGLVFGTTEILLLLWAYRQSRRRGDVRLRRPFFSA